MKAGRELDALIAEKVMGWEVFGLHCCDGESTKILPLFSTNIADAWFVVEKLRQDGLWLEFEIDDVYYDALFYDCTDGCKTPRVTTMSAPLSICLAALKACGVEAEG